MVNGDLRIFFSLFPAAYNQRRLTIKHDLYVLFVYLMERYRWRSAFPWLRFPRANSLFA